MILISQFFHFWDQIESGTAYSFLGWQHLLEILLIPISILILISLARRHSQRQLGSVLKILALAVPVVELTRVLWLIGLGETYWVKLLPLHLCGLQVIFIPLAVFTQKPVFQDYVWSTSILGGLTAILYPAGIVGTYPFIHFQTIQSLVLHLLLIWVPVLMLLCDEVHPRLIHLPRVLGVLGLCALTALGVDLIWGQNYMFLLEIPPVAIAQWLAQIGGYPLYWLGLALAISAGCGLLLVLGEYWDTHKKRILPENPFDS